MDRLDRSSAKGQIFEDLRVVDFTWAAAGPIFTKQFSDNGATVVKIESRKHPDSVRLGAPFKDAKPGINRSGFYADFNSSKLSVSLDPRLPEGREIVLRLATWADIVADNFRPGVLDRWGLGYDVLREANPAIIMISSSLYGTDGPWAELAGFGAQGAAVAGIHGLTGWADCPPAVPKGAYTDSVSPRYALSALMAALIYRERSGRGQYIELSQVEATAEILSAELIDIQLTGREATRQGNYRSGRRVHGVFPCAGDDNWIAIEVRSDEEWAGLCKVLGELGSIDPLPGFSVNEAYGSFDEIEKIVASVTTSIDAQRLQDRLQAAGVPAGVALKGSGLLADERLRARGHFWPLAHEEMGTLDYNGPAYRFEKTPSSLRRAAPLLGEDTDEVMCEILGMDHAEVDRLRESGVLE